jgi:hypothetical protein
VAETAAFPRDSLVGVETTRTGASANPTGRTARLSGDSAFGGAPAKPLSGSREDMVGGVLSWRTTGRLAMGRLVRQGIPQTIARNVGTNVVAATQIP